MHFYEYRLQYIKVAFALGIYFSKPFIQSSLMQIGDGWLFLPHTLIGLVTEAI